MRQQDYAGEVPDGWLRHGQQFDRQRFADLVRYICWICEDPRVLGLERLNRILWYVDRNLYLSKDRVATGASYLRYRSGPCWAALTMCTCSERKSRNTRVRAGSMRPEGRAA